MGKDRLHEKLYRRKKYMQDPDATNRGVAGIVSDTTESALRENDTGFRRLADLSPDAIFVYIDGRVRYANAAAARLLGAADVNDLLDFSPFDIVHPDGHALLRERLSYLRQHESVPALVEQKWRCRDGSIVDVEVSSGLTEWEGKPAIQVLARDIGQRKRSEKALRESEARYRKLFESIDVGFCTVELKFDEQQHPLDYRFVEVNPAFERHTGLVDAAGKWMREISPRHEQHWFDMYGKVALTGESVRFENVAAMLGDRVYEVFAFRVGEPGAYLVAILFNDISERKRIQEELRVSNERLQLAIHGSGDGVWDWNPKTDRIVVSARAMEILGYDASEHLEDATQWRQRIHPDDLSHVVAARNDCLEGRAQSFHSEYRVRCQNGEWKWLLSRGVVVARDSHGAPLRMTGLLTDISQRKQADELVWHHANFDALTGLPNRRMFRDRLDWEVQKADRHGHSLGLLFIDLDRFKQVNDLLGHDAGDLLLCQASDRIKRCVRKTDTVARLGGDEFTVILGELDSHDHVEQVAQKILGTLADPFSLNKESAYISGSIGITIYPDDGSTGEELIRKADQAMYAAKHAGKAQFSYFTRSMDEEAHLRLTLSSDLRGALGADHLQVYYQPIVELNGGKFVKAEALLRWQHPRLGLIEPSRFIPLAEETGMINEIGNWVFCEAASCAKRWSRLLGKPFQIGVNKSSIQFLTDQDADLLPFLDRLDLPPGSISVELTEGILLHASPAVMNRLSQYHNAGIQLAIDDFGTGYSSMAYLKKFAIDYLKIDQSFVSDIETDQTNRTIVESMIVMAHKLGMQVIAEGIETHGQMALLTAAGCDLAQGFLFSQPLPSGEFEQMLVRGAWAH